MAPTHPPGGRALSAAGESETLRYAENNSPERGDPRAEQWKPVESGEAPGAHATGTRVSPDPLRMTDRYRLVTPYKLKL